MPWRESYERTPLLILTESPYGAAICEAIRGRRLLSVVYGDRARIVEPYIHGLTSDGTEVLLCYQREGESASRLGSWRTLHLDRLQAVQLTDVTFPFNQADFDPTAREVRSIHCLADRPH